VDEAAASIGLEHGREALRRFLVGDDDLKTMLMKITLIATEVVPPCDFASISMVRDGKPMTPVFTEKDALTLDEAQYKSGDGPCLSAIRHRGIQHVVVASEQRWPEFTHAAEALGVTATLSVPFVNATSALGGINMYSRSARAYDEDDYETASLFADQIGVAAANVVGYAGAFELAQHLQEAMQSRAVIEQAKGILMAAQRCSSDAAFDILKRASQNQNRKLREIAFEVVQRYTVGSARPS
jgi:GAF domain-containing protein